MTAPMPPPMPPGPPGFPNPTTCNPLNPVCLIGKAVGGVQDSVFTGFATAVQESVGKILPSLAAFWVNVPTPSVANGVGGPSDAVGGLQNSLTDWTLSLAVLSVIIGGIQIAWHQRGEPVRRLVGSLLTFIIVAGAGTLAVALLVTSTDALATSIINQSAPAGFAQNLTRMLAVPPINLLGSFLIIILGICALFSGIVQLALMVVRNGAVVVLTGVLPTSAAAVNTEHGRMWFQRTVAWLLAFICYKPAAAFVYAAAFRLTGTAGFTGDAVIANVTGIVLTWTALLALPALMRLAAPAVSAVAERGGGRGAFGEALAVLPTGALFARSAAGSAAGSGGTRGATGPTGAAGTAGAAGARGAAAAAGPWAAAGAALAKAPVRAARAAGNQATNPPGGTP